MYEYLLSKYEWSPIANCPGRFILAKGVVPESISDLVGQDIETKKEHFAKAKDPVAYCFFDGGGMISYVKNEGYLHTLCNQSGMERKLNMLRGQIT